MNNAVLSFLGICRKAGKVIFGLDRTKHDVSEGTVKLVLVTSDFSEKACAKLKRVCAEKNVSIQKLPCTSNELHHALAYKAAVLGITDEGLKRKLETLLPQSVKEENVL